MSEPLARARRVVAVGAASLAIVLVALAAAAWRLVDAEEASAAVRGRSAAVLAVDDLVRAIAGDRTVRGEAVVRTLSNGELIQPSPPTGFTPMPGLQDQEAAALIRESEPWGPSLRRAALRRAAQSSEYAAQVTAAAAGARLELREGTHRETEWAGLARCPVHLMMTRDGVLLQLLSRPAMNSLGLDSPPSFWTIAGARNFAAAVVGSPDETDALAMLAVLPPNGLKEEVQSRRALRTESRVLLAALRQAVAVEDRLRAAILPNGDAVCAARNGDLWDISRVPADRVQEVARRVLAPRAMRLVHATAASFQTAVDAPGGPGWAVVVSYSDDESRSRSTLLLAGLGVAATAAVAAFAVFARSVRREARLATLRTDFVATVSHELRTPVAVVRTSAETLASGRAARDEDRQALTEAIVRESERLSSLVGNVLDFSRMESGRRTYDLRPTDLAALVRDVAARHAGVAVDVAADVPPVTCDADALGGAIGNLLDNARKYSSPDAAVTVRAARRGGDVVVEVEDHGIGVPDAEKPHVFERFFRGADARVRETRGAGIGLALVQHAASAHGGRVEVADTAGGGATFRIVLPCAQNG